MLNDNGYCPLPDFPLHDLARRSPPMTAAQYEGLKEDILANGLNQPIVVWRGMVIDGRHRYEACRDLGLSGNTVPFWHLPDDTDPHAFVWSANMSRRHLSAGQVAIISSGWDRMDPQGGSKIEFSHERADVRASRAGVSVGTQRRADAVFDYGDDSIIKSVFLGKISLNDAEAGIRAAKAARRDAEIAEQASLESEVAGRRAAERREAAERAAVDDLEQEELEIAKSRREAAEVAEQEAQKAAAEAAEKATAEFVKAEMVALEISNEAADAVRRSESEPVVVMEPKLLTKTANSILRKILAENPPPLPTGTYRTIVVDPPWPMTKISREVRPNQEGFDYPTMSVEEIAGMDVPGRFADDVFTFLWTTQKFLPEAFSILERWGLKYRFTMVWHKPGGIQVHNSPQFNCEFVVVGTAGNPLFTDQKAFSAAFYAPRAGHSVKPEEFYDLLRRVTPGPRLDMFSRRRIEGFDAWGNQA